MDVIMRAISAPGYGMPGPIILGLTLALLVFKGMGKEGVLLLALAIVSSSLNFAIRELVARPRPSGEWLQVFRNHDSFSFPSGHVMFVILVFGALAYLAGRHMAIPWQRRAVHWGIWAFIVLMGPARLMSLTHWPADIGASYLIAFPQLLFVYWLYPRVLPYLRDNLPWAYAWLHGNRVMGTRSEIA